MNGFERVGSLAALVLLLSACAAESSIQTPVSSAAIEPRVFILGSLDPGGEVLITDKAGGVVQTLEFGYDPEMAVSEDGTRLFVASSSTNAHELAIIDTESWTTLAATPLPDRTTNTIPPPASSLSISLDGAYLYALRMKTEPAGNQSGAPRDRHSVAVLDARSGREISAAEIPGCYSGQMFPTQSGIYVVCPGSELVYQVTVDNGSASVRHVSLSHPGMGATLLPGDDLVVVGTGGEVTVLESVNLRPTANTVLKFEDREVQQGAVATDQGGVHLLVGLASPMPRDAAGVTHLAIVDVEDFSVLRIAELEAPLWSITTSPRGIVYGVERNERRVWTIDAESGDLTLAFDVPTLPAYVAPVD